MGIERDGLSFTIKNLSEMKLKGKRFLELKKQKMIEAQDKQEEFN
jgi:hypothetical protein